MDGEPTPVSPTDASVHAMRLHAGRRRSPFVPLSLLLALIAQAVAVGSANAATRPRISYEAFSGSVDRLCVGETYDFEVGIRRTATINGQRYAQWVAGGYILGSVDPPNVGRFEPVDAGRDVVAGLPVSVATFTFVPTAPGRATLEFVILRTGEERRIGTGFPTNNATTEVEVSDCFDAYTSGLATTFVDKDMLDLAEPFFLTGYTPNVGGVTTETQYMFFAPNPQNRTTGGYAFVDTGWATGRPDSKCTAYISGRYDVIFYGDPKRPVEGDLLMKGSGVLICTGSAIEIDYTTTPGFQIGFKPRPAPP